MQLLDPLVDRAAVGIAGLHDQGARGIAEAVLERHAFGKALVALACDDDGWVIAIDRLREPGEGFALRPLEPAESAGDAVPALDLLRLARGRHFDPLGTDASLAQ